MGLLTPASHVSALLGLRRRAVAGRHRVLLRWTTYRLARWGVHIHPKAQLGEGLVLGHATGIVIGSGVEVGDDVVIYQNVTLGARVIGDNPRDTYPKIGDGVSIYAGACVLGEIDVGAGATIGANAVVLHDVEPFTTVAGVPAAPSPDQP